MLDLLINIVDSTMWVLFLLLFHKSKRTKPQLIAGTIISILMLVINIEITGNLVIYSSYTFLIDCTILFLYTQYFLHEKWYWKLFTILLYDICIFSCNFLCVVIFTNLFRVDMNELLMGRKGWRWCFLIAAKLMLLLLCGVMLYYKRKLKDLKKWVYLYLALPVLIILIVSRLMQILTCFYSINGNIVSIIWLICLISVLFVICFFLLFADVKAREEKIQNKMLRQQISIQEQIYGQQYKSLREVRRLQHDLKHSLVVVEQLLIEKDSIGAEKYLRKFLQNLEGVDGFDCGETVWRTLLSIKRDRAKASGICCEIDIKEKGLKKLDVVDICILLGNLLDNAIEAEEKIQGCRIIKIMIREEGLVYIQVKNRITESIDFSIENLITTKTNVNLHGFGILCVKEIVKKYNGICEFEKIDDWFQADIIL